MIGLVLVLLLNSCKKELLVKGSDNLGTSLSIAEAKSYFEKNIKPTAQPNKLMGTEMQGNKDLTIAAQNFLLNKKALWDKARQKMISIGGAVKVPLDFGQSYTIVDKQSGLMVPTVSLNYLLMYKDTNDSIHTEWVKLLPDLDWLKGKRDQYRGRIFVLNWEGKLLKNYQYGTRNASSVKTTNTAKVANVLPRNNGTISSTDYGAPEQDCTQFDVEEGYRVPNGQCPRVGVCANECDMCLKTCAFELYSESSFLACVPKYGGGIGGQETGNGTVGSGVVGQAPVPITQPDDYPPQCAMPEGGPDEYWFLNCENKFVNKPQETELPFIPIWTANEDDFFSSHPDVKAAIDKYLAENHNSQDAYDFAKWAVGYLIVNQLSVNKDQFMVEFFPTGPELIVDPNTDNWTDADNEILFDPDRTVYQEYQDNQPWPTVSRIIDFEKFVPMRKDANGENINCLILAKEQLGKVGYTCSGYLPGSQTFSIYTAQNGVNLVETRKAISYMINSLSAKVPVLIGIDNRPGAPSANKDKSTDHFVVVIGMGTDDKGKKYFQFLDSATDNRSTGASYANRLYYNPTSGKITGKTAILGYRNIPGMYDYIVTQVRKSIKK